MFLKLAMEVVGTTQDTFLARAYLKSALKEVTGAKERMMVLKAIRLVSKMED